MEKKDKTKAKKSHLYHVLPLGNSEFMILSVFLFCIYNSINKWAEQGIWGMRQELTLIGTNVYMMEILINFTHFVYFYFKSIFIMNTLLL